MQVKWPKSDIFALSVGLFHYEYYTNKIKTKKLKNIPVSSCNSQIIKLTLLRVEQMTTALRFLPDTLTRGLD